MKSDKQTDPTNLPITGDAAADVPVFSCTIYIRRDEDGMVTGRVANLAGLSSSGSSERNVLSRLSKEFKSQVMSLHQEGKAIPWLEPPLTAESGERVRSIPIHL